MRPGTASIHRTELPSPWAQAAAVAAYSVADGLARGLPHGATERLARLLARAAYALRVPVRARLEANLTRLLSAQPDEPHDAAIRGHARQAFEQFALAFVDFLDLERIGRDALTRSVRIEGAAHLARARAARRGVIVLSAHTGNWEWGAAYLAATGSRVHVLARSHACAGVERFFTRRRAAWGVRRLAGRPLWLAASRALRNGDWIAMMGDRPAPGARGSLCGWAAAISRRTGALVLPATMVRHARGRYVARFGAPLEPSTCARGGYRDAMRGALRSDPGQWFAFEPLPEGLA